MKHESNFFEMPTRSETCNDYKTWVIFCEITWVLYFPPITVFGFLFQCFINNWKQTQETEGEAIPEAQLVKEIDLSFCPI